MVTSLGKNHRSLHFCCGKLKTDVCSHTSGAKQNKRPCGWGSEHTICASPSPTSGATSTLAKSKKHQFKLVCRCVRIVVWHIHGNQHWELREAVFSQLSGKRGQLGFEYRYMLIHEHILPLQLHTEVVQMTH